MHDANASLSVFPVSMARSAAPLTASSVPNILGLRRSTAHLSNATILMVLNTVSAATMSACGVDATVESYRTDRAKSGGCEWVGGFNA